LAASRLGSYHKTGANSILTKTASNSPQEKFVVFQLSDVLSTKGNYIPAMLLDQFSI